MFEGMLIKAFIRRVLRQSLGREKGDEAMEWLKKLKLDGYKEKLTGLIGGLVLILTATGIEPSFFDWLPPLKNAIASGDWQASIAAFVAGMWALMKAFNRMKEDRKEKPQG